jgi:hypothetical protein
MGNRAVITAENSKVGVYLHWNGGRDSVEGFLKYCELQGYRSPDADSYGWARLCQTIANFFPGGLSVGIDIVDNLDCDNGDNGTYIIKDWKIVGRKHFKGSEQKEYDLFDMVKGINDCQPDSIKIKDLAKEMLL